MDQLVVAIEVLGILLCLGVIAISVTGRQDMPDWEIANLNRSAVIGGAVAAALVVLLIYQFAWPVAAT